VVAVKFREPFDRYLRRQWNTDCPSHAGCVTALGPWPAGRPACYRLAHGRAGAGRPTGQLRGLVQEKQSWFEAGRTTKYSTRLSVTHISCTHTDTHTHTHTHLGLRNGPTYMALALWLNSPPCKWSGVEWTISRGFLQVCHPTVSVSIIPT